MNVQQTITQIATSLSKRTSKFLGTAAIGLAVATLALAPTPAFASQVVLPDLKPDFLGAAGRVPVGERVMVPLRVWNEGFFDAENVSVSIVVGPEFRDITVEGISGEGWACTTPTRDSKTDQASMTCRVSRIMKGTGNAKFIKVTGTKTGDTGAWVVARTDPSDRIEERNEYNNVSMKMI